MQITKAQYMDLGVVRFKTTETYRTLKFMTEACSSMIDYPHEIDPDEMFGGLSNILDNVSNKIEEALRKLENIIHNIEEQIPVKESPEATT